MVFAGTFVAGDLQIDVADEKLKIISDGDRPKFIDAVDQITFSGAVGAQSGRTILYVTERCVFRLSEKGLMLVEIAPGVNLQKDILEKMKFTPLMAEKLLMMDARIFRPEAMGLKEDLLTLPLAERFTYQPEENLFFVNFEGLSIRSTEQIDEIREHVERICRPLLPKKSRRLSTTTISLSFELIEPYTAMVDHVVSRYYDKVTRYTTSAFMRVKLGDLLAERSVAPHVFEKGK